MKYLSVRLGFCMILIAMWQCQSPYENNELDARKKIPVVEGYVDNTDGPHVVSMHYARPYNSDKEEQISGAHGYITDGQGKQYQLYDDGKGNYSTKKGQLTGVIGESYKLSIQLPTGERILSDPAIIPPAIEIDNIYFSEFTKWTEIIRDASGTPILENKSGMGVFSVLKNIPEGVAYYRTSSRIIEHYIYLKPDTTYQVIDEDDNIFNVEVSKVHHWYKVSVPASPPNIGNLIADGSYTQDDLTMNAFRTQDCNQGGICPGSGCDSCMTKEWIIPFQVHAISPEMYQLYEDHLAQINTPDRIYDPIASQLAGNLFLEGEPDKPVLGLFEVSSVGRKSLAIDVLFSFGNFMYSPRVLSDTVTLPLTSEYRFGGENISITPYIN